MIINNNFISYPYTENYDSSLLRGVEEKKPWNLIQIILETTNNNKILLDIGCGTASKLIPLINRVKFLIGLEPAPAMLHKAQQKKVFYKSTNLSLVGGVAQQLPFPDGFFDIVTAMLAPWDMSEVHRVLKKGGHAILETIGEQDKRAIKKFFGKDDKGWRGQLMGLSKNAVQIRYLQECKGLFRFFTVESGFWETYYSFAGLIDLLEQTPTVRSFNRQKDCLALKEIVGKHSTPQGIIAQQHRVLIIGKK